MSKGGRGLFLWMLFAALCATAPVGITDYWLLHAAGASGWEAWGPAYALEFGLGSIAGYLLVKEFSL